MVAPILYRCFHVTQLQQTTQPLKYRVSWQLVAASGQWAKREVNGIDAIVFWCIRLCFIIIWGYMFRVVALFMVAGQALDEDINVRVENFKIKTAFCFGDCWFWENTITHRNPVGKYMFPLTRTWWCLGCNMLHSKLDYINTENGMMGIMDEAGACMLHKANLVAPSRWKHSFQNMPAFK